MQTNITAVILTKNEEKHIVECIQGLSFCKEVIVIDDSSSDKTVALAKKHGAIVHSRNLNGDFAAQRNFAFEKAQGEWVFFLDADERVSEDLANEIYQQTSQFLTQATAFKLKREDVLWGKKLKYGEVGKMYLTRIIKKDKGEWIGKIHEKLETMGEIQTLKNPLLHYPHENVKAFLKEINNYSTIRAHELIENKANISAISIITYPLGKFIVNYLVKFGFIDGTPGIIHALMMSFHSFLVRSKVWTYTQNNTSSS